MFYSKTRTRREPRGNNAIIAVVVIVIVILVGATAMFILKRPNASQGPSGTTPSAATPIDVPPADPNIYAPVPGTDTPETEVVPDGQASVKSFTVTGRPFSFTPAEIRVKRGDLVKITLVNEEGFHDWVIDEFSARTPQITAGQTAEVEFTADKAGTFEYYCSVGQHRQMGMKGNLIVE